MIDIDLNDPLSKSFANSIITWAMIVLLILACIRGRLLFKEGLYLNKYSRYESFCLEGGFLKVGILSLFLSSLLRKNRTEGSSVLFPFSLVRKDDGNNLYDDKDIIYFGYDEHYIRVS